MTPCQTNTCPTPTPAESAAEFLDAMADQLDRWAAESRSGGWSTHQVDANLRWACECRRRAAMLRRADRSGAK